jgi:LysR family transcriptional regulator, low CO2-responsive transcriptional regulator
MNPEHLMTFLAVNRHLNFTRAAEERFLSQPAISRQIKLLGEELDTPLFEQVGRSLHLTDGGRTLVPLAEEILGDMERAAEAVRMHGTAARGRLLVGASSTPGIYLLPHILGQLHRDYPEIELCYSVDDSLSIERKLVRNELDLGFIGARPTHASLEAEPFTDDEIVCFAGPSHPLAGRPRLEPGDLGKRQWITRTRGSATRRLFDAWLSTVGVSMETAIELDSPEAIKALVASGVGISFLSRSGLADDLERRRVVLLPVAGMNLVRPLYQVTHGDKHLSPVMKTFIELATAR